MSQGEFLDPGEVTRGQRLLLAQEFLIDLVSNVADLPSDKSFSSDEIDSLLANFRILHEGLGDDFEISHVSVALDQLRGNKLMIKKISEQFPNIGSVLDRTETILDDYKPTLT